MNCVSIENRKNLKRRNMVSLFHNAYTAWIVLLFGFVVTGAAWYTSNEFVNENAELRFETQMIEISKAFRAPLVSICGPTRCAATRWLG